MVMQIAFGIVIGFILLAALGFVLFFFSVLISKSQTFRRIDKYDDIWEEEEDDL